MTIYNVHLYREMRLTFAGIQADTPEAAAAIARARPTEDADSIDDCDGQNLGALVDEAGDEHYERSVLIDFESEREQKAAADLLATLPPLAEQPADRPIVTVSIRGGLVEELNATGPVTVVIEDWDVADEDSGKKPTCSVHALAGGLSGAKAEALRHLIGRQ